MGWQVVKQPNEKYAIWSTIVDEFICKDMTEQEITDVWVEARTEDAKRMIAEIIEDVDGGSRYYIHYDECISTLEANTKLHEEV